MKKKKEGEQVKGKPKKKRAKRQKIKCPECDKPLVKCRKTLKCHYDTFHASVTNDVREEQIEIVMKKSMPLRADGTRSTDPLGDAVRTVKDGRIRRTCMYCENAFSYSHLIAHHLNLDSKICCNAIPQQDIAEVKTEEQKKKWKSATIAKCEKAEAKKMQFRNIYAGESLFTTDMLLELVEKFSQSYQDKLHVDLNIKSKLSKGQKLDPEERKINYRTRAVRNQQKRVMDHIFGDSSSC